MKHIHKKTPAMKQIETAYGLPIEEILRRMFVDEGLPSTSIQRTLGISNVTLIKWLQQAGVWSRKLDVPT